MKDQKFLGGLIVALGVVGVIYYMNRKKKVDNLKKASDIEGLSSEAMANGITAYRAPVQAVYDIVLPHAQVAKSVQQKAAELTEGRYDIIVDRVKTPIYLG
jgi:hypothetical protein